MLRKRMKSASGKNEFRTLAFCTCLQKQLNCSCTLLFLTSDWSADIHRRAGIICFSSRTWFLGIKFPPQ